MPRTAAAPISWTLSLMNRTGSHISAAVDRMSVCGPTTRHIIWYTFVPLLPPGTGTRGRGIHFSVCGHPAGGAGPRTSRRPGHSLGSARGTSQLRTEAFISVGGGGGGGGGGVCAQALKNIYIARGQYTLHVTVFPFTVQGEARAVAHLRTVSQSMVSVSDRPHSRLRSPLRLRRAAHHQARRHPPTWESGSDSGAADMPAALKRDTVQSSPLLQASSEDSGSGDDSSEYGMATPASHEAQEARQRAMLAKRVYHFVVSLVVVVGLALLGITLLYIVFVGNLQMSLSGSMSLRRAD